MAGKSKRVLGQLIRCTKCGQEKSWQVGPFKSDHGKPRQPCASCDTARRNQNAADNRERERTAGRERMARWRASNPEKVARANRAPRSFDRDLARERINAWRRAHPAARIVEFHNRKARKQNLPHRFTRADWQRCLTYWEHRCCICGRAAGDGYALAQEHWIALADPRPNNPGTVAENIVPMCHARNGGRAGCNNTKSARDVRNWLVERLGQERAEEKIAEVEGYFASLAILGGGA